MTVDEYIKKNNGSMSLDEVFRVINEHKPFDAVQILNVQLFDYPFNLHSYGEQIIDGQSYCFRFTPEKIFVSKRSMKKVKKDIIERYSFVAKNQSEKHEKRTFIKNNIAALKRILTFKNDFMMIEKDVDFPIKMNYFISDALHKYRSAFDGKFNTCCQKRMIKNMIQSKPYGIGFFDIAFQKAKHDFLTELKDFN